MIKFKKSSTGDSYINFQYGRIFITESEKCITLKAHKTWKGRHSEACQWLCLSIKSQKPIVYRFVPRYGIQNITYQITLLEEINSLLDRVSSIKDKDKRNIIKLKVLTFCNQLFGERYNFKTLNVNILTVWMPLLNYCENVDALKILPMLKTPLVREGFKKESLKDSINFWFGHSPKGLTKRIATILEQKNFSQLILALSCRSWNLDHLYSLLDSDILWDVGLDIKKASFLLTAYPEKRWLKLLKTFNPHRRYDLYDSIELFHDVKNSNYSLPNKPASINYLHNDLFLEFKIQNIKHYSKLQNMELPQEFSNLDNIKVGELKIITPKLGNDLFSWGKQLNNCLMSYVERVGRKEYSVVGIFKQDKIKYALGIFNGKVQQFSGNSNSLPLPEDEKMIREVLTDFGIN